MDAKSQTTLCSYDTKLGIYVLKKIYKKISTSASREVQIDPRFATTSGTHLPNRSVTAAFGDLKSILSNSVPKLTPSKYRRWWIKLLPISLFKEIHYHLKMDDLPRHWSNVDEITELAEATQIKIGTRCIVLPTT